MTRSAVKPKTWRAVYRADAATEQGGLCFYCQEPLTRETLTADHFFPSALRGATSRENIKAACLECNRAKANMRPGAFFRAIKSIGPETPFPIMLAFMRRKIWVRTHRACGRIERYAR